MTYWSKGGEVERLADAKLRRAAVYGRLRGGKGQETCAVHRRAAA